MPKEKMSVRLSTDLAFRLLGAHVGGGAENDARSGRVPAERR